MLKAEHIHFIGIGGIGISALAKMFLRQGRVVSGSDSSGSSLIEELKVLGASIFLGHKAAQIPPECDLVIYTNALAEDNTELVEATRRGVKTLSYPEALGEISKDKFTIAISGNAGKTTTTAMLGQILIDAELSPTIIAGSLVNFADEQGKISRTNFIYGDGKYFVVEADEYKRAFLNLKPEILAITNIEEDHLDYYKDLADIQGAFMELANKVPKEGFVVCFVKDEKVASVLENTQAAILDYTDVSLSGFTINLPGEHNRENARVAITIASALGVDQQVIEDSMKNFRGLWRRFEYKGETSKGMLVYDDYAHNPKKIKALIAGVKEKFPKKRIVIIFQPHLYSRTKHLLDLFAESFVGADRVIIVPIYAAREANDLSISHYHLSEEIKKLGVVREVETVDMFDEVLPKLESEGKDTVCLTVGAGDIYTLGDKIVSNP